MTHVTITKGAAMTRPKSIRRLERDEAIDLYLFMTDKVERDADGFAVFKARGNGSVWSDQLIWEDFNAGRPNRRPMPLEAVGVMRRQRFGNVNKPRPIKKPKADLIDTQAVIDLRKAVEEIRALVTNHHHNLIEIARRLEGEDPKTNSRILELMSRVATLEEELQRLKAREEKVQTRLDQVNAMAREQTAMIDKICLHLKTRYGFDLRSAA